MFVIAGGSGTIRLARARSDNDDSDLAVVLRQLQDILLTTDNTPIVKPAGCLRLLPSRVTSSPCREVCDVSLELGSASLC